MKKIMIFGEDSFFQFWVHLDPIFIKKIAFSRTPAGKISHKSDKWPIQLLHSNIFYFFHQNFKIWTNDFKFENAYVDCAG